MTWLAYPTLALVLLFTIKKARWPFRSSGTSRRRT